MQRPETPTDPSARPLPEIPETHWLRTRTPTVPSAFLPYLFEAGGGVPEGRDLTSLGVLTLSRALSETGRNRDGAFHLLVADALLTYACELVVEGESDVRSGLARILGVVGGVRR